MKYNPQSFLFKAFEILMSRIRFSVKMVLKIFLYTAILHITLFIVLLATFINPGQFENKKEYLALTLKQWINPNSSVPFDIGNGIHEIPISVLRQAIWETWDPGRKQIIHYFWMASQIYIVIPIFLIALKLFSIRLSRRGFLRGSRLITPQELNGEITKENEPVSIPIGEVLLPLSAECQMISIKGTTGSGKTVFLSQVVQHLIERDEQMIIVDLKGDMISRFYSPKTDMIFNPHDVRTLKWSPLKNDVRTILDLENQAGSQFPEGSSDAGVYFNSASRNVRKAIDHFLWLEGKRTNQDIWNAITAPASEILAMLQATEAGRGAARHIEDIGSRQSQAVLSTVESFSNGFYHLAKSDGPFSVKDWIENGSGRLFISNHPQSRQALKSVISLFIDVAGMALLSRSEYPKKKIFIILDEFGTLHPLNTLVDLLTLGRSRGVSLWLASQDWGRIREVYGNNITETLQNNCGTRITFRCQAYETAQALENEMGEQVVTDPEESHSMGPENERSGLQLSRHIRTQKTILAAELMALKNFSCIVKIRHYNPAMTTIPRRFYDLKTEPFLLAPWLMLTPEPKIQKRDVENPKTEDDALDF